MLGESKFTVGSALFYAIAVFGAITVFAVGGGISAVGGGIFAVNGLISAVGGGISVGPDLRLESPEFG